MSRIIWPSCSLSIVEASIIDTDLYLFFALLQTSTGVHLGKDKTVPLLVACASQFQRVIISLTFSLTWSIITFLHLEKNENVLARQLLITKRMLRLFHVTDCYWSISTRKAVIGQLLKGWQEIVSLSDTCKTWRRVQTSRKPRFHPGFWLVRLNGSASFPSRFSIGPFQWVSLVSIQVSDWSVWMSHVAFWTTVIASYQSLRSDWSIWKILLCDWLFVVGSEVYKVRQYKPAQLSHFSV